MKIIKTLKLMEDQNIDLPSTTIKRKSEIRKKFFLKKIYSEFYKKLLSEIVTANKKGKIVELGSGAGFVKKIIPNVITSDIMNLPNVDLQFSALKMPFKANSINALVMIDVFHHINDIDVFLGEANRVLKKGGQIVMIEPSNTFFGGFIYKYFHHEPYNPKGKWSFADIGPLSSANSALPWIVFIRDRKKFERKNPYFEITKIESHTPLKYLLSGGFSFRQLLPNFTYPFISFFELLISPLNKYLGIFYTINIIKRK